MAASGVLAYLGRGNTQQSGTPKHMYTVCIRMFTYIRSQIDLVIVKVITLALPTLLGMLVKTAVADPEGVPYVPWNPSFEGLPSKILCANVACILRSHLSYSLQLQFSSNNTRVSTRIKNSTHAWPACTYILPEAHSNHRDNE